MSDVPPRTPLPAGAVSSILAIMDEYAHAHAAAAVTAARDCRTCVNFDFWPGSCKNAVFEKLRCTNADRYEPLPPVRLWRTI